MAATDHSKHSHSGLFSPKTHNTHETRNSSNYADNHKHFHANSSTPSGFHFPHHASTAPNLSKVISSDDSDDEPTFPPHPPKQHPQHSHTISFPHPHLETYVSHHHRELFFGHDARHAKHDAASPTTHSSSTMPTYVQDQSKHVMTEAEEIKLFEEQERERRRVEEQALQDKKSWEEVVKSREKARRRSGAFDDRNAAVNPPRSAPSADEL